MSEDYMCIYSLCDITMTAFLVFPPPPPRPTVCTFTIHFTVFTFNDRGEKIKSSFCESLWSGGGGSGGNVSDGLPQSGRRRERQTDRARDRQ